jgi:hypothetical protein
MTFKQFIWHGQDSQKQRWKDVPVEHEDTFRQLPTESKDCSFVKSAHGEKKKRTHVQILLL